MTAAGGQILLGTVALEPNRWGTVDPSGAPRAQVTDWVDAAASAGFDGLELWERHLDADDGGPSVLDGPLPVAVFNTYVDFDDPDPTPRRAVAERVARARSRAVKFNVGDDPHAADRYARRLAEWIDDLPDGVAALCECHQGISIAEDPDVAAALFDAAGTPAQLQAIVHTHEEPDHLRRRFEAYGDRITHVHVNYLDPATLHAPALADRREDLAAKVDLLAELGFAGSWTIEFVAGVLTERDEPGSLVVQAEADLAVLRSVLERSR